MMDLIWSTESIASRKLNWLYGKRGGHGRIPALDTPRIFFKAHSIVRRKGPMIKSDNKEKKGVGGS